MAIKRFSFQPQVRGSMQDSQSYKFLPRVKSVFRTIKSTTNLGGIVLSFPKKLERCGTLLAPAQIFLNGLNVPSKSLNLNFSV